MRLRRRAPGAAALRVALLAPTMLVATACADAARAGDGVAEPPVPLLTYCAPPVVPTCLDDLRSHPEGLKDCAATAEAYKASVFAYRVCLARETERAVREANAALAKLRCAQVRADCKGR